MQGDELLVVFLKAPTPGRVKTRIGRVLGNEAACKIYRLLVERLLSRLELFEQVELRVSPDRPERALTEWLRPGWRMRGQGSGSLGQRLARAFAEGFSKGRKKIMAIGSDCPYVRSVHLTKGFRRLGANPVVLGPTVDGGYWSIGMTRHRPELFEGIDWSTSRVLAQTRRRLDDLNLVPAWLETLEDIDDVESWRRYLESGR